MSLRHVTGVTLGLGLWLLAGHGPIGAAQPASTMDATAARAVVDRYCVACHNERTLAGDLSLDSLDLVDEVEVPEDAEASSAAEGPAAAAAADDAAGVKRSRFHLKRKILV